MFLTSQFKCQRCCCNKPLVLVLLNAFRAQHSQTLLRHSHYLFANVWMSTPCKHLWHTCLNAADELTKHSWVFPIKVHRSSTRLHWPVSLAPDCTHTATWMQFSTLLILPFLSIYLLHIKNMHARRSKGYEIGTAIIPQSVSVPFSSSVSWNGWNNALWGFGNLGV